MTTATAPRPGKARLADTCRLEVVIRGERYTARPLASEDGPAWRLRKQSDGSTRDVSSHPHGAECDCADFVFRRDGIDPKGCKHVRALKVLGLLGAPALCPSLEPASMTRTSNPTTRPRPDETPTSKARPEPAETVLEDDPTDPDNGDPAGWPEWTDAYRYVPRRAC